VPLAMALCKNLPAENNQRWLSRTKPTSVAVPIEEEEVLLVTLNVMTAVESDLGSTLH